MLARVNRSQRRVRSTAVAIDRGSPGSRTGRERAMLSFTWEQRWWNRLICWKQRIHGLSLKVFHPLHGKIVGIWGMLRQICASGLGHVRQQIIIITWANSEQTSTELLSKNTHISLRKNGLKVSSATCYFIQPIVRYHHCDRIRRTDLH